MGTDKKYEAYGKTYNPTSLSSFVFEKLKEDAEAKIGPITEAVVTVPANFANDAREATLAAAKTAGLSIKNIINEPTAAAVYYAFESGEELNGYYAVYDLGGGTFDISIIKVVGTNIEVIISDGVAKLGGDDFDNHIVELVKKKCKKEFKHDLSVEEFTKKEAEEVKKILSVKDKTKVLINSLRKSVELTKEEFENEISTLIAQTEMTCENALSESNLSPNDIQEVILAGGSTRMPCIRKSVKKIFNKDPKTSENPDEAIALGAALFVAYKSDKSKLTPLQRAISKVNITEITNKYFETE